MQDYVSRGVMSLPNKPKKQSSESETAPEVTIETLEKVIKSLRYGVVQIIIQDGRIVQIEKTEKIRFT